MLSNRSVPVDTILPHVVCKDVGESIKWLTRVFGLIEHYRYGDPTNPQGAQMRAGGGWVMLHQAQNKCKTALELGYSTQSLTVFVDDVAPYFERAKAEGAKIVEDLEVTAYGEKQFGVQDLDGHEWLFSQHVKDVSPEEWGATLAKR